MRFATACLALTSMTLALSSCATPQRNDPLASVMQSPTRDDLRRAIGREVVIEGRALETKAGSSLVTDNLTIGLPLFWWHEGEAGQTRRIRGLVAMMPAYTVPERSEEISSNTHPGQHVPDRFLLRDARREVRPLK